MTKKFICPHCGAEFHGTESHDSLGWHTACPVCTGSFDTDGPEYLTPNKED